MRTIMKPDIPRHRFAPRTAVLGLDVRGKELAK